jgi:hypothetical protein
MAETVAVYAVPHTPSFVAEVQVNGERSQTAQFFSKIRSHLQDAEPDVIVTVNNDHFNTFLLRQLADVRDRYRRSDRGSERSDARHAPV